MTEEFLISKLERGTLCKVVTTEHKMVKSGDIVEFCFFSHNIGYNFKNKKGIMVLFKSDSDFQVVPHEDSVREIIDLALSTKDEEWFNELCLNLANKND
ncbi:gp693 [Bacillus phage G]|uniref:Gp693 n=1 Tax=Bacillus phage G TaxID=2884420 RepID=G3MB73_9CAUD|nr:gp693 [Bacillus phage G]AEO93936.1 gp693 [Bacillus phage G]